MICSALKIVNNKDTLGAPYLCEIYNSSSFLFLSYGNLVEIPSTKKFSATHRLHDPIPSDVYMHYLSILLLRFVCLKEVQYCFLCFVKLLDPLVTIIFKEHLTEDDVSECTKVLDNTYLL